jgi:hypothetical protein
MLLTETKWKKEIKRPLKDKLHLQGPNRGFFAAEDPHFYTSIFLGFAVSK